MNFKLNTNLETFMADENENLLFEDHLDNFSDIPTQSLFEKMLNDSFPGQTAFFYAFHDAPEGETQMIVLSKDDIKSLKRAHDIIMVNPKKAEKLFVKFAYKIRPQSLIPMLESLPKNISKVERSGQIEVYLIGFIIKMAINAFKEGHIKAYDILYRAADAICAYEMDIAREAVENELKEDAEYFWQ